MPDAHQAAQGLTMAPANGDALDVDTVMGDGPVIPVLVIGRLAAAAPVADALVRGGVRVLEITLRTDDALDAIRHVKMIDGAIVGAGTVLNPRQLDQAVEAGARFIVSPGLTEGLAKAAANAGVPLLAGVATATDIMRGLDLGLTRFKFFPAETSGGVGAVKAFGGPFANVKFCPTGGVSADNAAAYLAAPNVVCVGGSWLTPSDAVEAGDWARIEAMAKAAAGLGRKS
jgi:2-dehydro-3-deoxyphosphogluconate aldolase/(4S)-4-hydroxy-2-oxoglutarate aldolase